MTPPPTRQTEVSSDELRAYHERGWAIVPGVFTATETARIATIAMQVSAAELASHPDERFTVDISEGGDARPRKIDYPFLKHSEFRSFALDPRLTRLATAFLGHTAFLIRDQLFCKPPRFGTAKPYHQENAALLFDPPDHMLITWIALDDATTSNGCLRFIDGSHHTLLNHHAIPGAAYHLMPDTSAIDLTRETVVPVRRGAVVIIHSQTLHGSAVNKSDTWRRAYTCHWVTDKATCATDALTRGYSQTVGQGHYLHRSP